MKSNILSGLVILISLFFYAFYVQAQEKPESPISPNNIVYENTYQRVIFLLY